MRMCRSVSATKTTGPLRCTDGSMMINGVNTTLHAASAHWVLFHPPSLCPKHVARPCVFRSLWPRSSPNHTSEACAFTLRFKLRKNMFSRDALDLLKTLFRDTLCTALRTSTQSCTTSVQSTCFAICFLGERVALEHRASRFSQSLPKLGVFHGARALGCRARVSRN